MPQPIKDNSHHPSLGLHAISHLPSPGLVSPCNRGTQFSGVTSFVSVGDPAFVTSAQASVSARAPRHNAMHFFVPRPFPPPALANVPLEYIVHRLHNLAPHYWSKPETADCTIIIPLDALFRDKAGTSSGSSSQRRHPNASDTRHKAAEPSLHPAPRMVMKLHIDYLSSQCSLLRGLFGGASPLDLIQSTSGIPSCSPPHAMSHVPSTRRHPDVLSRQPSVSSIASHSSRASHMRTPPPLLPRILPSSPTHPTIYLPVPDPSSLRLLIHYIYFGSTTYIEDALDSGAVTWEGLARNVEYLGMGRKIKICLGRWYGRWRRERATDSFAGDEDDDDDSDAECQEDDMEVDERSSARTSITLFEDVMDVKTKMDIDTKCPDRDEEHPRGRRPTTRRLGHFASDPGPIRPPPMQDVPSTRRERSE